MTMPTRESPAARRSQWRENLIKFTLLLLLAEPVWVSAAVSFVYLSVIYSWASFVPWLCLAFAFSPFVIRLIRYGRPGWHTPFDIPIMVLLSSVIVGMVVSEQFDVSLGAFQTFLAATAFYYYMVNYSRPSHLIIMGLSSAAVGIIIASVFAAKWASADIPVPHGLGIALVIIVAIALGITIFNRRISLRVLSGVFGSMLMVAVIFFTYEALHRLITLESIEGRLQLWLDVISPIEGSSLWTGLGLGCWPLAHIQEYAWMGHVHNAYLELYINTGIFGLAALICFMAVGAKLSSDIIYSSKSSLYYGFGIGVVLATLAVLSVSFVESSPFGFGLLYGEEASYHYILSPVPFILAGSLVIAHRLSREGSTTKNADIR